MLLGILKYFNSGTYKAAVQLAGSLTTYFEDVPVSRAIPTSALVVGNRVILAIPGGNPKDACVIATWPGGSPGGAEVHGNEYHDPDFASEAALAAHAAAATGIHGVGSSYLALAPSASHLVRSFTKGWTSGRLLQGAGVGVDPSERRLKDFLYVLTSSYIFLEQWKNLDGWTESHVGSGSLALALVQLTLSTGTTIDSRASIYSGPSFAHAHHSESVVDFITVQSTTSLANSTIKLYVVYTSESLPPSNTCRHAGFEIVNGQIYASNADGTNRNVTDTGVNISTAWYTAKLRMIGTGSGIEFYVNWVLKATHTTYLSTQWNYKVYLGITNQSATNVGLRIRPIVAHG
jgi:hypothetical protein